MARKLVHIWRILHSVQRSHTKDLHTNRPPCMSGTSTNARRTLVTQMLLMVRTHLRDTLCGCCPAHPFAKGYSQTAVTALIGTYNKPIIHNARSVEALHHDLHVTALQCGT